MKLPDDIQALVALREQIENDPSSKENDPNSLYLRNKKARKKILAIDEKITYLLVKKREEEGNPVPVAGYSGRKTNRC